MRARSFSDSYDTFPENSTPRINVIRAGRLTTAQRMRSSPQRPRLNCPAVFVPFLATLPVRQAARQACGKSVAGPATHRAKNSPQPVFFHGLGVALQFGFDFFDVVC